MADLRDIYQEVILEHAKSPRNFHALEKPTVKAEGYNPLCGDRCTVYVSLQGDVIEDIGFQGSGCAISRASASMMTQSLKGKTVSEAERPFSSICRPCNRPGRQWKSCRVRQAGGIWRRCGVSCTREVRDPGVAYAAGRTPWRSRAGDDGVGMRAYGVL